MILAVILDEDCSFVPAEGVGKVLDELEQSVLALAHQHARLALQQLSQQLLVGWRFVEGGIQRVRNFRVGGLGSEVPDCSEEESRQQQQEDKGFYETV